MGAPCFDSKLSVLRSVILGTSSELSVILKSGRNFENLLYNFKVSFLKQHNFHCWSIIWTFQTKTYKPLDLLLRLYIFQFSMDLIQLRWFWWSIHPLFRPYLNICLSMKTVASLRRQTYKLCPRPPFSDGISICYVICSSECLSYGNHSYIDGWPCQVSFKNIWQTWNWTTGWRNNELKPDVHGSYVFLISQYKYNSDCLWRNSVQFQYQNNIKWIPIQEQC